MFRTRDFILIFTCVVFLLTAIGATVLVQMFGGGSTAQEVQIDLTESDATYEAIIMRPDTPTREERLQDMRNKIAAQAILSAPEQVLVEEVVEEELVASSSVTAPVGLQQCASYQPYAGFWDARDLEVVASEGAILVVRNIVTPNGSTTVETLVQLPKRLAAAPSQSCIGSDVIGIANDGSLIRNDEVALYSIFGADVQIGYTLDGFPLYGVSQAERDQCGGRVVAGGYRYELGSSSETIVDCFAAAPVNLP